MRNFTPDYLSAFIQANAWDNICAGRRKNRRRLNNHFDGDITARVNDLGSTIETLEDTLSRITDDQTDNGGGNKDGRNNIGGGKNTIAVSNNGGKMHRMKMVAEIKDVIAATLAAMQQYMDKFLI